VERIIERCAGLDVHNESVTACVRLPGGSGGLHHQKLGEFASTTRGLLQLRDWLASFEVEPVSIEATGVY
jgi:transposase